jgi:hypothetical protein
MLSLPLQRRHLRRTAALTLLAWMLALLSGMVNACQLQLHTPGTHPSTVLSRSDAVEHDVHAGCALDGVGGVHDQVMGHHDQSDAAKAGCLKFCADESSTVAKGELAQPDLLGMAMVVGLDWQPAMPMATVSSWRSVERPVSQGPPLFIRFLRLTI